jgi:hypothetical protein
MKTMQKSTPVQRPVHVQSRARTKTLPPLSPYRAFVVQFREGGMAGRVEHIVSGETVAFRSWKELKTFLMQVLNRSNP